MMIALLATIAASSLAISSSTSSSEGRSLADCDAQHDALDLLQRKSQAVEAAHRSLQSQDEPEPDRTAPHVFVQRYRDLNCAPGSENSLFDAYADEKTEQSNVIWFCECLETGKALKVYQEDLDEYFVFPDGVCVQHFALQKDVAWIADASACPTAGQAGCTVHGDPHITVFDQAQVALLGVDSHLKKVEDTDDVFLWGDFWLVKSEQVQVQARYRKVYYPKASEPLNHTYLTAVAVGGPFLRGYTLMVEPRSGSVTWVRAGGARKLLFDDHKDIDNVFKHEDLIKATYSDRMPIVPKQAGSLVSGLDVELPSDVKLKIDRFAKHLDARIEMAAAAGGDGGVDGQCGNFNGDPTDDTAEMLEQRMGNQVPKEELLFS